MCSIKVTLQHTHGQQQTFARSLQEADVPAAVCLKGLRVLMGEVQTELNSALTQLVERERSTSIKRGKTPSTPGKCGTNEDDDSDEEDEDSDKEKANGNSELEPPDKIKKTF